jgi:hypothetical protein
MEMDEMKKTNLFEQIEEKELSSKDNPLYNKINNETKNIFLFLNESINKFHLLFNKNLKNFEDSIEYLEKISIPNKCVCAGVIDNIPGWRCNDCSKYENVLYCNDCYKKSKDLHKGHKIFFLIDSNGMCDCGDPDSLYTFCPDHSGPHSNQKQIDEYISKSFEKDVLDNLKTFFGEFFSKMSKYLIVTEKCKYFYNNSLDDKINLDNINLSDEIKKDINLLKSNFCVIFNKFIKFLKSITEKNLGMLHLVANYFLTNHLENQKLEEEEMTTHRCIKITENDIKLFDNEKNEKHACLCPFFRLFITNYRDEIGSKDSKEFLLSFSHNLPLRCSFSILFFSQYKDVILNNNVQLLSNRIQFFLEDVMELIAKKTKLIEESYEFLYQYAVKYLKSPNFKTNSGAINERLIRYLLSPIQYMGNDTGYFAKPKMRKLMTEKTSIMKRVIDIICLIHNENEIISIVPHPEFQHKGIANYLINIESSLLNIVKEINIFIEWEKMEQLKDIFKYLINKILNQKKEGIKQLKEDEYSFHLGLYRCFGLFLNSFCFNFSFNNNDCKIIDAIQYFTQNFFESKNQVDEFIDIIKKDYFKLFGFIAGAKNNYFNYYNNVNNYNIKYFRDQEFCLIDFSLLKYLFVMNDTKIDIISFLKISNIENVFSSFEKSFISNIKNNENINKGDLQNDKDGDDINMEIRRNRSDNIGERPVNYIDNAEILSLLRNDSNQQLQQELLQRLLAINNLNDDRIFNDVKIDENNCIMQWKGLLEILIIFIKDDSCIYWDLMGNYSETISPKTKRYLFNVIRKNKDAMHDLENILKEKIIQEIIAENNMTDVQKLKKNIDNYLQIVFEENNKFNELLDELTFSKMNGETKMIYLKDSYLNNLDINYYISYKDKSKAERYILEFKKDSIKPYNYYYYIPSKLTFELFEKVYEKILLNKNNLELFIKIVEKLLSNEKITKEMDMKSVINLILPVILNYLLMFSVINNKAFIEFKIENKDLIIKLRTILDESLKKNKESNFLEKDLEENVVEVINQLNKYQIIYDGLDSDLSKLNNYDYNINILEKLKTNNLNDSNIINLISKDNKNSKLEEKEKKSKNMKNKIKNLMKKKADLFMDKISTSQEILQIISEKNQTQEKAKDNNEIMCFFCRNPISMNSFEVPYGKLGLLLNDYFYINSMKATIRSELSKLTNKDYNKNNLYDKIIEKMDREKFNRINSCGHYFHMSCFTKGLKKRGFNDISEFTCPLCLKNQNILIPPLNNFREKLAILQTEKIDELLNAKSYKINNDCQPFVEFINNFLIKNEIIFDKSLEYFTLINRIYPYYKCHFNFLENIFYIGGTTFHKHQQIDTLKNINLSLRFMIKANNYKLIEIVKYIKNNLTSLAIGPNESELIYSPKESYMFFVNLLEKILLSLTILFDYDEMKTTFKYIIYIFLPYFCYSFYFRDLALKKEFNELDITQFNEKMNMDSLQLYLKENNKQLLNYLNIFLKKFCIVKLLTDFDNKNEDIIYSFNELSVENLLSLLDMKNLYELLPKNENNEICIIDIIKNLPKIFNTSELFYKEFEELFNYNKVFDSIFNFIKENLDENIQIGKELIIQFAPIKFEFTYLDNNIFDWIERNIEKKCDICNKQSKFSFICLICGNKVCHEKYYFEHSKDHVKKCGGTNCIFVDMDNMKIYLIDLNEHSKKFFPIYVNEAGNGPKGDEIGNEYNLSHDKLHLAIKNYVCNDFNLN